MCTSLLYFDAANRPYLGRTLELSVELPYQVSFVPTDLDFSSTVAGFKPVTWKTGLAYLAVTMPGAMPQPGVPFAPGDMKIVEGVNTAGLTFSVQSYPTAGGDDPAADAQKPMLSAIDLGAWVLGQFTTVADVKAALENQEVLVDAVPLLGGQKMPFHYGLHDATGASMVIEFHHGVRTIHDNPVGVMTNAPQFDWHLTNLNNYTFLTNVDHSKARFGGFDVVQPGAGIAKAGLPPSDTSVDRFVRAAYYAQFAEKQTDADKAVQMVAHLMNNFDRPRGITVDPPEQGSGHLHLEGQKLDAIPTEFTSWTSLTDLARRQFHVRDSGGMSYATFDLPKLAASQTAFRSEPLAKVSPALQDVTATLA